LQQREEHWAIVDLVGKAGHVRTVPVPDWVKRKLDEWLVAAAIDRGKLFRRVNKVGRTWGESSTVGEASSAEESDDGLVPGLLKLPVIVGSLRAGVQERGPPGARSSLHRR
jgi:hypothetical protein